MKFNLKTYTIDNRIFQELESEHEDITTKILRQVYDTKEKQLREALVKLGWTPPKIPNADTASAIKELKNGGGTHYKNSQEMYKDLEI